MFVASVGLWANTRIVSLASLFQNPDPQESLLTENNAYNVNPRGHALGSDIFLHSYKDRNIYPEWEESDKIC